MRKILLIEDDFFKAKSINQSTKSFYNECDVKHVTSLCDAIDVLNEKDFDLVLVDMAIPSHEIVSGGSSPQSLLTGGIEILLELNSLGSTSPCIVITQYPDIEISGKFYSLKNALGVLNSEIYSNIIDCIEYREGSNSWEQEFILALESYENFSS